MEIEIEETYCFDCNECGLTIASNIDDVCPHCGAEFDND